MKYDFLSPGRIVFGWGRRAEIGALAASICSRVFLVSGSRTLERHGLIDAISDLISQCGIAVHRCSVASREPEVADVDSLVKSFLELEPTTRDCVVAIGGGSTIDLAKATAALVRNRHGASVVDFLEGGGRALQITEQPLSVIAVPTTSGTGAEVTKNSVISSFDPPFKRASQRLDDSAICSGRSRVDGELPQEPPLYGMDAITQLMRASFPSRAPYLVTRWQD